MNKTSPNQSSSPWKFFGLTFLLTWGCWLPAGFLSLERFGTLKTILHYAGGVTPTLAALLLLYFYADRKGRRDYWQRLAETIYIASWWGLALLVIAIWRPLRVPGRGTLFP